MRLYLTVVLILISLSQVQAVVVTVGSADDANCDFNDLQLAIDSVVEETEIRVSNTLIISGNTSIQNKAINILQGGYVSCAEDAEITSNTEFANGANAALFLYFSEEIIGSIEVSNFDFHSSAIGISIDDNFVDNLYQMTININNNNIYSNNNGIDIQANQMLINIDYVNIYDNGTLESTGGGLVCRNAQAIINILEHTAIYENLARFGAGIYLSNCDLNLFAGGINNNETIYGVFDNNANYAGGGMYLFNSQVMASGDVNHPVIISSNGTNFYDSDGHGGAGVYISKDSTIDFINAFIDNNNSVGYGAAIYARYYTNLGGIPPIITLRRHVDGCNYAEYCSSISHNITTNDISGSVFNGYGDINISQTIIEGNKADKALFNMKYNSVNSDIVLEGNLIIANSALNEMENSQYLFYSEGELNSIKLNFTTISDNQTDDIFRLSYRNLHPQNLHVYNSIINNPGSQIINTAGTVDDQFASIECSILHDLSTEGVEDLDTQVADPLFIDGYKLSMGSLAINPNCSSLNPPTTSDIVGKSRLADAASDLGAYEYLVDSIFGNDFE